MNKSTNYKPHHHFNNRKYYIRTCQIIPNFHIGQVDRVVVTIFGSSDQEVLWKLDVKSN